MTQERVGALVAMVGVPPLGAASGRGRRTPLAALVLPTLIVAIVVADFLDERVDSAQASRHDLTLVQGALVPTRY